MSLIARLIASAATSFGFSQTSADQTADADEHLAAMALLVHVALADGVLDSAEKDRLINIVRSRYAASRDDAEALIERAITFDAQTRDLSSIVELLGHEDAGAERSHLLALAWSVASADGDMHEFEEALVWRLGKLLGLDEAEITQARIAAGSSVSEQDS